MKRSHPPKITVIGAASSSFSGLLADLVANPDLNGATLALVDIQEKELDVMARLGRRMAEEWDRETTILASTDRKEVLADSDFVITTIAVGGVKTWRQDEDIPAKHGYYGHSVDTVGPGGLFRGLRLIPPLLDVAHDIEALCPQAWVINYSNPMAAVCSALLRGSGVKTVGLCTAGFLPRQIARHMDIEDENRIEVVSAGVNHWVWAMRVLIDGEDRTEEFHNTVRKKHTGSYYGSSVELLDIFDCWPMPGANHVAEFFPYFYGPADDGRDDGRYPFRSGHDFDERLEKEQQQREDLAAQASGEKPLGHEPEESAGEAVRMILSVWQDRKTRHFANVPNRGAVPNLPDEAVVEIPVLADAAGFRPIHVGPLPQSVVGLVQARIAYNELLAEAALQKSRHLALQCLVADPLTWSLPKARACIDEMFQVQAEFLPGYE